MLPLWAVPTAFPFSDHWLCSVDDTTALEAHSGLLVSSEERLVSLRPTFALIFPATIHLLPILAVWKARPDSYMCKLLWESVLQVPTWPFSLFFFF